MDKIKEQIENMYKAIQSQFDKIKVMTFNTEKNKQGKYIKVEVRVIE